MARKGAAYEKQKDMEKAIEMYKLASLEDNSSSIKDSLRRVEKHKKDNDAKAYINPEIAEQHKNQGTEFF